MIRVISVLLILAVVITSCKRTESTHLDRAKMEAVLLDIAIADAASAQPESNRNYAGMKNMDTLAGYYHDIFAHHQITQAAFQQSLQWYKANQEELDTVLAHVIIRADALASAAVKIPAPQQTNTPPPTLPKVKSGLSKTIMPVRPKGAP